MINLQNGTGKLIQAQLFKDQTIIVNINILMN